MNIINYIFIHLAYFNILLSSFWLSLIDKYLGKMLIRHMDNFFEDIDNIEGNK